MHDHDIGGEPIIRTVKDGVLDMTGIAEIREQNKRGAAQAMDEAACYFFVAVHEDGSVSTASVMVDVQESLTLLAAVTDYRDKLADALLQAATEYEQNRRRN